jgi:hypothetical protein
MFFKNVTSNVHKQSYMLFKESPLHMGYNFSGLDS